MSKKEDFIQAVVDSISTEAQQFAAEIVEAGIDTFIQGGLLNNIPIVSAAMRVYKIGKSFIELHFLRKMAAFIEAFNRGIIDEEKREYYKKRIKEHADKNNQEIEYVLVLLSRYVDIDKAKILAAFCLAYLDQRIDASTFFKASEALDRLLPGDYEELGKCQWINLQDNDVSDSLLRLVALGLVVSHNKGTTVGNTVGTILIPDSTIKDYELTGFGQIFLDCILSYETVLSK